jgi:RHS repeat-associated protein
MAANGIYNKPGEIVVQQYSGGTAYTVAQRNITYNSLGEMTSTAVWNGTSFLTNTNSNTYNSNGTPLASYDLNNNETGYTYSSSSYSDGCNGLYPFPTSVKDDTSGLTTTYTYDCLGGVVLSAADANGDTTNYHYNSGTTGEPYWRALSVEDPDTNTATATYPNGSTPDTSSITVPISGSTTDVTTSTVDGYGRPIDVQKAAPGSTYDTVSTGYLWETSGTYYTYFQTSVSQPCSTTSLGSTCTTAHFSYRDALGRTHVSNTTSNETVTNSFSATSSAYYVVASLTPAPTGENAKQTQTAYDGLGRVTSICHIGSTANTGSGTACPSGSYNGAVDAYTYSAGTGYTKVSVTRAGTQTRSSYYDAMGRLYQSTTPEGGTWNYYYDSSYSGCPSGWPAYSGKLIASKDPNGNVICYKYDSLGRPTLVNANNTTCRNFIYDTNYGTLPTGVSTPQNTTGRLAEAYTTACSGSAITDEWFSYDNDGNKVNLYQSSPHSTQYYNSLATFNANNTVASVQLSSPSLYTMHFGIDSEGRPNTVSVNSGTTVVYSTTYNAASQPTAVDLIGASSDNDSYTYDPNTGRMTGYTFTVGATPASLSATLTWNPNGTLSSVATTDGFNSGGSLTCVSNSTGPLGYGYDDWGRLMEYTCKTTGGADSWGQEFSYDLYDNLSKSVPTGYTGTTWSPGYTGATNQFGGGTFDSNGNTKADGNGNYWGWNEFSKMAWYNTSSTAPTCGTNGKCATYDAFGRMIEQSNGTSWREYWFTQAGKVQMSGTTENFGYFPAAAGTVLITGNNGAQYYLHNDWLGDARITSTHSRTVIRDQAFTPYGEIFASYGTAPAYADVFAGTTSNFNTGTQWDTPNRSLAYFGRWLSPDPAGQGGQWNRYAYPTNPNSMGDPSGLCGIGDDSVPCDNPDPYPPGAGSYCTGYGSCDLPGYPASPYGPAQACGAQECGYPNDGSDPKTVLDSGWEQGDLPPDVSDTGLWVPSIDTYAIGLFGPRSGCGWNLGCILSQLLIGDSDGDSEPNPYVSIGLDVLGVFGDATHHSSFGRVGAAINLVYDHSPTNVAWTGAAFIPVVGEGVGAVAIVKDVGTPAVEFITNQVIAPMFDAAPPQNIPDGNGYLIPNPALMSECQIAGAC